MNPKKTILVAPLNWGLGHAVRCIPIIRALKTDGYEVIIASDGEALGLLTKEFPETTALSLPGYNIQYSIQGRHLKQKLIASLPKIYKAIQTEHRVLQELIETYNINGVISDNRLGLYSSKVPTVYITHQLRVLSGTTTGISSYMHHRYIKKFNECWVPDWPGENNLSGGLGHPKKAIIPAKYIGSLSRMTHNKEAITHEVIAVLSGPEPQRTLLENKLIDELYTYDGRILIVQGIIAKEQQYFKKGSIEIVNYLTSQELEKAINCSALVIARSGYTTIMDLANLGKKAFFIPTPGQREQEYLAQILQDKGLVPFCTQNNFKASQLTRLDSYSGFKKQEVSFELRSLFGLF